MANAAIAYQNWADAALVSASSQVRDMPPTVVQGPHIAEHWRSETSADFLMCDLLSARPFDTVMLRGLLATSIRIRASAIDSSALTAEVLDTGTIVNGSRYMDLNYDGCLYLLPMAASARYFRIDIANGAGSYVEAGRVGIFERTAFTYNFAPGQQTGFTDRSTVGKTRGGQTLTWNDNRFRIESLSFDWVTASQRFGIVETIDRICGRHQDVLLIRNTDSDNLVRDSIWGLMASQSPVVRAQTIELYSKQYQIEERL